jgi:hypothetical protein
MSSFRWHFGKLKNQGGDCDEGAILPLFFSPKCIIAKLLLFLTSQYNPLK